MKLVTGTRTLDDHIAELRQHGFAVRFYGDAEQGIIYQVQGEGRSALRYSHDIPLILAGKDPWFGPNAGSPLTSP